ncbi:hypothetical protein Q8A67_008919 [Cirrhinus molitorella]|uniref:Ig-like domain-containing protein n=1 Tax=Cirrhinus molitorella TaxID=172907 RepID=A0AA88PR87_9TELE|nr:hypothetical protein Q8A67_008919 [Cirrhinus molitorella]
MFLLSLWLILFFSGDASGEDITPLSSFENATNGDSITLACNYDGSYASDSLLWYRQYSSSKPEFLFLVSESDLKQPADPPIPGVSTTINKEKNRVDLEISSVSVSDSAMYYCALKPTVTGNEKDRYVAEAQKNKQLLNLEISKTEVADAAIYYCALVPTVTGNPSTLYKNLR